MTTPDASHDHDHHGASASNISHDAGTSWIVRILMFVLLGVGAYYVIAEHGAHLLGAWPLLFLLACLPMHMFHGGHGGHGGHRKSEDEGDAGGRNG
jgi:hypothetical protein